MFSLDNGESNGAGFSSTYLEPSNIISNAKVSGRLCVLCNSLMNLNYVIFIPKNVQTQQQLLWGDTANNNRIRCSL